MMNSVPDDILADFLDACHRVARRGLVRCSSGNMSRRLDDSRLLATASRTWMEDLCADGLTVCRITDGAILEGPKPTVELGFHTGILRTRREMNVVLHYQSPCATIMACREAIETDFFVIPEIPFYIGPVAIVPYLPPGSDDLASAVSRAMQDHDMVIMRNHGIVTVATDYAHAIQNAEFFELACEIIVHGGHTINPISRDAVDRLLEQRQKAAC